jgi:hypothetical protein
MNSETCFVCGRRLNSGPYGRPFNHPTVITIDGQRPAVGHDCARKVANAGEEGYRPPLGGPRVWTELYAPEEALAAAGITIIRR